MYPEPDDIKPYSQSDVSAAEEFVTYLDGRTVSQAELEEAMLRYSPETQELDRTQGFYDSGPWASGKDETFRDIESFTVACVLGSGSGNRSFSAPHRPDHGMASACQYSSQMPTDLGRRTGFFLVGSKSSPVAITMRGPASEATSTRRCILAESQR